MDSNHLERTEETFLNVHEIMTETVQQTGEHARLVGMSLKVTPELRDLSKKVCAQHGTDPSKFLRKCLEHLISGYYPKA